MKANFKKWLKDNNIPTNEYYSWYANQFAEDLAEEEVNYQLVLMLVKLDKNLKEIADSKMRAGYKTCINNIRDMFVERYLENRKTTDKSEKKIRINK